jgi:hypothetical protein
MFSWGLSLTQHLLDSSWPAMWGRFPIIGIAAALGRQKSETVAAQGQLGDCVECLGEVGDQVVDALEADRQPDQRWIDSQSRVGH